MTPKREKIIWIIFALALVLLFLMSSTNLIIKEKKAEVYPISIVVGESTDDYYVNFKKGIEQAAIDYHADVSFITLYERNQAEQQMDLMIRELHDGARALIVAPVDDSAIAQALDGNVINGPLVLVDSALSHNKVSVNISIDYYEAGKTLAEQVVDSTSVETPVYLVAETLDGSINSLVYDGLMSVFREKGYETQLFEVGTNYGYREIIEGLVYPENKEVVLVAIDLESLTKIAQILEESTAYQRHTAGLYGFGSTLSILNYLDKGIIDGIVVTNDFIKGYLSIQKAVEAIQNKRVQENIQNQHFYIQKEDIRIKEYQKLLYPID